MFKDQIFDFYYNIKCYINNRWITKTHYLKTDLKPGKWHEFDTRILHGLFNELVDFVEIEQAWMNVVFDKEKKKQYQTPFWRKFIQRWRNPEAGIEHLEWASNLMLDESWGIEKTNPLYGSLSHQAESAREILKLYNWWKFERPQRPDPYEVTNFTKYASSLKSLSVSSWTKELQEASEEIDRLEKKYFDEDTEMLIRLIKIRNHLWT